MTVLAEKQRRFIQLAKSTSSHDFEIGKDETNETKPKEIEDQAKRSGDEQNIDEAKPIENVEKLDEIVKSNGYLKKTKTPKIISPFHGEPSVDLNELVRQNQTDAQIFLSKVKDKNRSFLEDVFDY